MAEGLLEVAGDLHNPPEELGKLVLTLFVVVAAAAAVICVLWWGKKKGRGLPPGPMGLPLLGSLPFLRPDLHCQFVELAAQYGPVMSLRLGTKLCVVVSSPAGAKEMLRDRDAVFAFRDVPVSAAVITNGAQEIGWNNDPESWRFLRKVTVRELLSSSSFDGFYALRKREVRRAVRELYERCGTVVTVGEALFQTLLDLMLSMLWGSTLEGEERTRVGREFREVVHKITENLGVPNVSDFIPALAPLDLQRVARRMKKLAIWCDSILDRIIDKRVNLGKGEGAGKTKDFLQVLLDVVDKKESELPLTIEHVKGVFLDIIVAATDTTTGTMEWAMAEMMEKPEVMRKVQEELDAVVGKDAAVEESHLPRLPYLDAVVKETLRLHPALPLMVPHSPSEPSELGGFHIPVGSRVLINAWAIHRDPSIWEDPSEFKPERFLTGDARWDYNGSSNGFRYIPFGSGRRSCVGILMAERMSMFLLATLLHSYDWKLPAGDQIDLTESIGIVLKMAKPLTAIPSPRLSNLDLYS
ncbi:unnamed protein product [Spirodela intermedia]|uniref:Uncharacterized protein n=1 Tax=Spirodela intermedia TaxID=51605 RepID=A0A7I8K5V2_SPIIN|nr:unnamed protein product [Spirodela intermedia]